MPKNYEVSGPAFVALLVRDAAASGEFYEKMLGFRRDPEVFPGAAVAFLTCPPSGSRPPTARSFTMSWSRLA